MLRTRAPLTIASPFDLHVLGPPQTFALSQDQTLQFELCSIMIEDSLEPSTGCRCRPAAFAARFTTRRGVDSKSTYPQASCLGFPLPLSSFQGASRVGRAARGVGDLCSLTVPVKFFLAGFFQPGQMSDSRLPSTANRVSSFRSCRFQSGSPPRSPGVSLGLLSKLGGPGGSKGGGVYPEPCFPSSAFSQRSFRFGWREGRSPHVAEARDRLSPIGSARQDQFLGGPVLRDSDSAHRFLKEQTPGARRAVLSRG